MKKKKKKKKKTKNKKKKNIGSKLLVYGNTLGSATRGGRKKNDLGQHGGIVDTGNVWKKKKKNPKRKRL